MLNLTEVMSMIACFVQVSPDLLTQALGNPSLVPDLFETDERRPIVLTDAMRQDWQRRMPQLLAGFLAHMNPAMRFWAVQSSGTTLQHTDRHGTLRWKPLPRPPAS
ncbi:MAG: hypothetical protein HY238_14370 [Acidobacteria bacterium]|nr:hypothetical protein [Acidobacteriota bacterium]